MRLTRVRFRFKGHRRVCLILVVVLSLVLSYHSLLKNVEDIMHVDKCPACYGVSLCSKSEEGIHKIPVSLDFWGRLGTLANTFATKNVFSGQYKQQKVIIKRLGLNHELEKLDERICHSMELFPRCDKEMKNVVRRVPHLRNQVKSLLSRLPETDNDDHPLTFCPSTENVDLLFRPLLTPSGNSLSRQLLNDEETANIWTLLLINPEPLLFQILRAEDGWPVPHYIGSCGRIVVIENAGLPLLNYYSMPWAVRAGLALQLLLAADRFTYSHPRFAFYLLDISLDNIVVNEEGKLTFVDLEHVIVVDRHPSVADMPNAWNDSHFSEVLENCHGCYTFSATDICSHHISDHNHFITCQQLLASGSEDSEILMPGGLLHSVPSQISLEYPQILKFLHECSADKSTDRVRSARRLRDTLNIASKESPMFADQKLLQTWKFF